jgi:hypothetical protein
MTSVDLMLTAIWTLVCVLVGYRMGGGKAIEILPKPRPKPSNIVDETTDPYYTPMHGEPGNERIKTL